MKLLIENWRKHLKEADEPMIDSAAGTVPDPKLTREEQTRLVDTAQEIFSALSERSLRTDEEGALHAVEGYLVGNEDFPENLKEPLRDLIKKNVELQAAGAVEKGAEAQRDLPKEIWPEE